MISYLIGIDYRRTPLDIREAANRDKNHIIKYWQLANPERSAVLSTCNRVEIYGIAESPYEAERLIRHFRRAFKEKFKDGGEFFHTRSSGLDVCSSDHFISSNIVPLSGNILVCSSISHISSLSIL